MGYYTGPGPSERGHGTNPYGPVTTQPISGSPAGGGVSPSPPSANVFGGGKSGGKGAGVGGPVVGQNVLRSPESVRAATPEEVRYEQYLTSQRLGTVGQQYLGLNPTVSEGTTLGGKVQQFAQGAFNVGMWPIGLITVPLAAAQFAREAQYRPVGNLVGEKVVGAGKFMAANPAYLAGTLAMLPLAGASIKGNIADIREAYAPPVPKPVSRTIAIGKAEIGKAGEGGISTGHGESYLVTKSAKSGAISKAEYDIINRQLERPLTTEKMTIAEIAGEKGQLTTQAYVRGMFGKWKPYGEPQTIPISEVTMGTPEVGKVTGIKTIGIAGKEPVLGQAIAIKLFAEEGKGSIYRQFALVGNPETGQFGTLQGISLVKLATSEGKSTATSGFGAAISTGGIETHLANLPILQPPSILGLPITGVSLGEAAALSIREFSLERGQTQFRQAERLSTPTKQKTPTVETPAIKLGSPTMLSYRTATAEKEKEKPTVTTPAFMPPMVMTGTAKWAPPSNFVRMDYERRRKPTFKGRIRSRTSFVPLADWASVSETEAKQFRTGQRVKAHHLPNVPKVRQSFARSIITRMRFPTAEQAGKKKFRWF